MSVRAIGFLDVSVLAARFTLIYKDRLKDDPDYLGAQTIVLRSATADAAILKEWKSARDALLRLKNAAAPFLGGKPAVLGKAMIVALKPGAWTDWAHSDDEYTQEHFRLHVRLCPSPAAFIYSGGMGVEPLVGQVVVVDQQALHSQINLGPCRVVDLVVDVHRPVAADD